MKLYHGSNMVIDQIDLSKCKPYKDGIIFRNFDDVIIDLQMLFKYKKVSSQYLFHSAKAIKYLHRL